MSHKDTSGGIPAELDNSLLVGNKIQILMVS
jgi:hypothetical protein